MEMLDLVDPQDHLVNLVLLEPRVNQDLLGLEVNLEQLGVRVTRARQVRPVKEVSQGLQDFLEPKDPRDK